LLLLSYPAATLIYFLIESAPPEFYTLSLHDALPILVAVMRDPDQAGRARVAAAEALLDRGWGRPPQATEISGPGGGPIIVTGTLDRKSTRLNSSHVKITYAGFCLKKKEIKKQQPNT